MKCASCDVLWETKSRQNVLFKIKQFSKSLQIVLFNPAAKLCTFLIICEKQECFELKLLIVTSFNYKYSLKTINKLTKALLMEK